MPKMRKTFRLYNRLWKGPNLISAHSERENSCYLYGMLSEREIVRASLKHVKCEVMAKKSFLGAFLELAIYWVLVATSLQIVSIMIVLTEPHARYSFVTALMLIASTVIFLGAFYVLRRSLSHMFTRASTLLLFGYCGATRRINVA